MGARLGRAVRSDEAKLMMAMVMSMATVPLTAFVAFMLRTEYEARRAAGSGQAGLGAVFFGLIVGAVAVLFSPFLFVVFLRILRLGSGGGKTPAELGPDLDAINLLEMDFEGEARV
jgi:hypothetical protein